MQFESSTKDGDCPSSVAIQMTVNGESPTVPTTTMATHQAEKKQKVKAQLGQIFLLSMDGFNLTQEAAQNLEVTDDNAPRGSHDNIVYRKLLRRRHVRKLQKERKTVSAASNTTRPSATFGGYRPTVSPIRPRMLHSTRPESDETLLMPPMSPIQSTTMRDWEDYRHPALGVKRKLESAFL
eukprot:scaffold2438_cov167-Amphora_coffeaeformis.AAC.22